MIFKGHQPKKDKQMKQLQQELDALLNKREKLYLKGSNDEKLNDKIRELQLLIRTAKYN